jgi:hypothetical protein
MSDPDSQDYHQQCMATGNSGRAWVEMLSLAGGRSAVDYMQVQDPNDRGECMGLRPAAFSCILIEIA